MKKRRYFTTVLLLLSLLLCTGCGNQGPQEADETNKAANDAIPGSYTVPEGWVEAEEHSTEDKIFYVEEGHEKDQKPDNISINVGTNKYAEDEHVMFREAILQQLTLQIQGSDAQLNGSGSYSEQDYILYTFTIEEPDSVTKQYYLVGDHRYCLIHLTNVTGSESADAAAEEMVNSFIWDDAD